MIELVDVVQHYGVRPVLRGVSLTVGRGELVVVVGPNGMGKTTLLGVMAGVLPPQRGQVRVAGRLRRSTPEDELAIRKQTVYLPDRAWLPAQRTGREFLLAVGRLYDVPDERLFEHVDRLLGLFDLAPQAEGPIRSYSAGQQKKIALAGALVTEAPLLLLDEPFSGGLDPSGLMALKRVLKHRVGQEGATVVLTSPVPEIVEEIADKILILQNGQVAAFDTLDGLRRRVGHDGPLGSLLERLLYPETLQKLDAYFGGRRA